MELFMSTLGRMAFLFSFIAVIKLRHFDVPKNLFICALCAVSVPPGLNMVVIPGAYGKDTTVAAGIARVTHLLSCITIPIIFTIAI